MEIPDIHAVLAEATQHFDRLAARFYEQHGTDLSPYREMAMKLRKAREALTKIKEAGA